MSARSIAFYSALVAASFGIAMAPAVTRSIHQRALIRRALATGLALGDSAHHPQAVEFADYECPACRAADSALVAAQSRAHGLPALRFHFLPLEGIHPFAFEAAVAAVCAAQQGRFESIHHLLFQQQPELGHQSWGALAMAAGVPDTVQLTRCMDDTAAADRVIADERLAADLHLPGTPSFLVDGRVILGPLPDSVIRRLTR